ncbi:diguanylate cyclase, partial [Desulfobacula sp.]|uniref:sensor domain-containing diguanylate cyclase n=1 Tax=Desulfobacula sp. TaxID=2593537 RepID=UPI001EB7385A|nr:GGDEF domain-containing protein [Desulfobacula sp.]
TEYLNPSFVEVFGWTLDELRGKRIPFVPDNQEQITSEKTKELLGSGNKVQFETQRLTKQGSSIDVIISASCIKNLNGKISKLVVILKDITDQKQAKQELKLLNLKLEHEATHDPLTGALNRRAILDILSKELNRAKRRNTKLSIGLCDIDHFKLVNDKYGHQVGDDVLCSFIKAIQNTLRPYDLLGRYGGEEFLLVMPDSTMSAEEGLYERLRAKIADNKMMTRSGGVSITVSIGITSNTGNETIETMIAKADAALYRAKENGRNQLAFAD